MGFLDRLLGRDEYAEQKPATTGSTARTDDEIAIERYRYLLRTAPPEAIEQVHAEAFGSLTPEQRAQVFAELSQNAPAGDAPLDESPAALARSATRSELRQPGILEKSFAGGGTAGPGGAGRGMFGGAGAGAGAGGGGLGFGGVFASSLLGSVAGYVIGSSIAQAFIPDTVGTDQADAGGETGDAPADDAGTGDAGAGDAGAGDAGAGGDWSIGDATAEGAGGDWSTGDTGGDWGSDLSGDFGDFGV
ncbi:hypothetical protein C5B96_06955 [Subtercola sp. Z020]|uniref:hypothetical protein n=1 Tax=Subtercola sp. Z020 TaxID=2080582 RepID=UPI000CE78797|nr:hypothetical protein [Subtercola sp. Z020]PPF84599.1 hypothetical protein C5B96_06955 [Subtercola sp. Z020]